jgi:hypothetical protein
MSGIQRLDVDLLPRPLPDMIQAFEDRMPARPWSSKAFWVSKVRIIKWA